MIHWSLVVFSDLVFSGHLLKYEMHKAVKQTLKTIDKYEKFTIDILDQICLFDPLDWIILICSQHFSAIGRQVYLALGSLDNRSKCEFCFCKRVLWV